MTGTSKEMPKKMMIMIDADAEQSSLTVRCEILHDLYRYTVTCPQFFLHFFTQSSHPRVAFEFNDDATGSQE